MRNFSFLCKEIWLGKSVTRAFYNARLKKEKLTGKTIDIGGGSNPDYLSFMPRSNDVDLLSLDIKTGSSIDFEKDTLPAEDEMYDTVLFLNVLEHIYNYTYIMSEVVRVTKPGGKIIGVVPFLMWYHPDHSDYFRYTNEALAKIFNEVGAHDFHIENLARGPFTAAAQMIILSVPRLIRVPMFAMFYLFDSLFLFLRPRNGDRYTLGYFFVINRM